MEFRQRAVEDLEVSPDFWRSKKVLLTGHTGFKGGWMSLWLQRLGAQVVGFSLPPDTKPNFVELARVLDSMESVIGDIRVADSISQLLRRAQPDIVIHMAAQALVRRSYAEPVSTFATNLQGTVNLLEATRGVDAVRAVLVVTSDKCYENDGSSQSYAEDAPLGGSDPYSSSKACAEIATAAYRRSFFSRAETQAPAVATVRAGNVIGGGDWALDRVVPDAIRAFSSRQPVRLRYPRASRPWQHVLDPLHGYLLLIERLVEDGARFAEAWNFGPATERTTTVAELISNMARRWGNEADWIEEETPQLAEAATLQIDAGKARRRLGWTPRLNLDASVGWTVDWYKAWHAGQDLRAFSELQIDRFAAMGDA
jgi:CDP-glucose 4,6-dehydratase